MNINQMVNFEILDVERFIKVNEVQEVSNIITFNKLNEPTSDGLLSKEIFGTTSFERTQYFGYIDLHGTFIDPSCYNIWCQLDRQVKECIHGTNKFIIKDGQLIKDDNGFSGIDFLKNNFDKLIYSRNSSRKRDMKIEYLLHNKDRMFIKKMIVNPAFYRDSNTTNGNMGLSSINKLYHNLLMGAKSLKDMKTTGYGDLSFIEGRIQDTMLEIYRWYVGKETPSVEKGTGLYGKYGYLHMASMAKTVDKSCRLIITAPDISKAERISDMTVNLHYSGAPLSAVIATYQPFLLYNIRRMVDNEYFIVDRVQDPSGKEIDIRESIAEVFSEDNIIKEMKYFIKSYSNRLKPIIVTGTNKKKYYIRLNKKSITDVGSVYDRPLTWMDIFFISGVVSVEDKCAMITRYPVDSHFSQFPTKVNVVSTRNTELTTIDTLVMDMYPIITRNMIGKDTSNLFIDALQVSNLYMNAIGGDYDGDMVNFYGVYTREANEELERHLFSKRNYISMSSSNVRLVKKDAVQSLYSLTYICKEDLVKLSSPIF